MERMAEEIMDTLFPSVQHDEPLESAVEKMEAWRLSVVPVVETDLAGSFLVGTLSEADILATYVRGRHYLRTDLKAADVMRPHPLTVNCDTPLSAVASIFLDLDLRFLPVVQGGRLAGIIRRRDVLKVLAREYQRWTTLSAAEGKAPDVPNVFTPVYLLHEARGATSADRTETAALS